MLFLLIACFSPKTSPELPGQRCETACQVDLSHPGYPDGESYAKLTLHGGTLVTEQGQGRSVSVLAEDPHEAHRLAQSFLSGGVDPRQLGKATWVMALDDKGVVQEYGKRGEAIKDLVLTP